VVWRGLVAFLEDILYTVCSVAAAWIFARILPDFGSASFRAMNRLWHSNDRTKYVHEGDTQLGIKEPVFVYI
jgi:hypothetical protein